MAAACARAGESHLDRARRRARRRNRRGAGPAGSLGRRHPGAQGDADQLSSVGRDRRRPAGRHRGGAGAGPVLVDQRAPAAAAVCSACRSRPTGITAWCSMPPGKSCRNRPRPPACANFAPRARRRPTSAAWSACLILLGSYLASSPPKAPRVTPVALACHGGAAAGESWRQDRAHGAPRGRRKAAAEEACFQGCAEGAPQASPAKGPASRHRHGRGGARRVRPRGPHAADRNSGDQQSAGDLRPRRARAALGRYHQGRRRTSGEPRDVVRRCRQKRRSRRRRSGRICSICARWRATPAIRSPAGRRRRACSPRSRFRKSCRRSWSAIPFGCARRWKT